MVHVFYTQIVDATPSQTAHALAKLAYTRLTGLPAPEICKEPAGKPYFLDCSWHLSISHTRRAALCALSEEPVALDAEQPRLVSAALMRRCLSEEELAVCQTAADPTAMFLRFWTLKEAYGKYLGCGIVGAPAGWSFRIAGELAQLQGEQLWFLTRQIGDLTVSVCSEKATTVKLHIETADML